LAKPPKGTKTPDIVECPYLPKQGFGLDKLQTSGSRMARQTCTHGTDSRDSCVIPESGTEY
jgi:hypothetical protein